MSLAGLSCWPPSPERRGRHKALGFLKPQPQLPWRRLTSFLLGVTSQGTMSWVWMGNEWPWQRLKGQNGFQSGLHKHELTVPKEGKTYFPKNGWRLLTQEAESRRA